jgi:hypothetical protein
MTAAPSGKAQKREIPSSLSAWPTQRSEWVGPTTSSLFYLYRASPSLPCAPLLPSPYLSCSSSCPLLCLSLYTTRVQGGGKIFFLFGLLAAGCEDRRRISWRRLRLLPLSPPRGLDLRSCEPAPLRCVPASGSSSFLFSSCFCSDSGALLARISCFQAASRGAVDVGLIWIEFFISSPSLLRFGFCWIRFSTLPVQPLLFGFGSAARFAFAGFNLFPIMLLGYSITLVLSSALISNCAILPKKKQSSVPRFILLLLTHNIGIQYCCTYFFLLYRISVVMLLPDSAD